jgi:hypothetical protein
MALVVRADFHCDGWQAGEVKRRAPAFLRLSATARRFSRHLRTNAFRFASTSAAVSAQTMSR